MGYTDNCNGFHRWTYNVCNPVGDIGLPNTRRWIFNYSITGGEPVRWFVNSPIGLTTDTTYLASTTFYELAPTDSNSNTVELNFRPGFSGNIIISAEPVPCPGDRVNYVINVPEAPQINLTSGFNSNNITVCNGTAIDTITYDITGAADLVLANNLPSGVLPMLDRTSRSQQYSCKR